MTSCMKEESMVSCLLMPGPLTDMEIGKLQEVVETGRVNNSSTDFMKINIIGKAITVNTMETLQFQLKTGLMLSRETGGREE